MDIDREQRIRAAVFHWLDERIRQHGEDVLDYAVLAEGVPLPDGGRQPLFHRNKGIYKPAGSPCALTLRTSLDDPYGDRFDGQDTLLYRMQEQGPAGEDNRAVLASFERDLPFVYLGQLTRAPVRFAVVHPVWVVDVDSGARLFRVQTQPIGYLRAVEKRLETKAVASRIAEVPEDFETRLRRAYGTSLIRRRLHQAGFRERVLAAYERQCAMCRLRRVELLDAAHIDPDASLEGEPLVANGISLCRIHHGAFDAFLLGVDPRSLSIRVRADLLREEDGPMLRHGLQELEGSALILPRRPSDRPDPERLQRHWDRFARTA